MRPYSTTSLNRKHSESIQKDGLLEQISASIAENGLRYKDLVAIDPTLSEKQASRLRQQDRSVFSLERLQSFAAALDRHLDTSRRAA